MSGVNRARYLTETVLNQEFLDWSADNLECRLEVIVKIQTPTGFIYASDRNKYVGDTFYQALLIFPTISRTVGEWLAPTIQFSNLSLELSNVDGRFNKFLPGGANYQSFVGRSVEVKVGLGEVESTYTTVFKGQITEVGGVKRNVKSVTLTARDRYDLLSVAVPKQAISRTVFTKVQDDIAGKFKPIVYGDWTVSTDPEPAIVPGLIVNARDPLVTGKKIDLEFDYPHNSIDSKNHCFSNDDRVQFETQGSLPSGLSLLTDYYVINVSTDSFQISTSQGGGPVALGGGASGSSTVEAFGRPGVSATRANVQCLISENDLVFLDTTRVWMKKGELFYLVPQSEIVNVGPGNKTFEVKQNSPGITWVAEDKEFLYESGDLFFVKCRGKDLGVYSNNPVEQARDLLLSQGQIFSADFHGNWDSYRDKASPAESAIATTKSRIWFNEPQPLIEYALSLLEQVRLEAFVDRAQAFKLSSLHFDDFVANPSFKVKNWDLVKDSFNPQLDEKNNFNRAQGTFDYHPDRNENARNTGVYRNQAAISQTGRVISKRIVFPNLYVDAQVALQVQEILKLASALFETVVLETTWRALLLDIGQFLMLDVDIGSTKFTNVPCLIRDIGYNPAGLKIPLKVWSFQIVPFPGYSPGYAGTVGGSSATITLE